MSLTSTSQSLDPGEEILLFRLDATKAKASVYYFTQASKNGAGVSFGGQVYAPIDIVVSDFKTNAGGVLPTPKMQIANSDTVIQGLVNNYGDLCGCEVRRIRTFARFLDGAPEADGTSFVGPDVFRIERKSDENKNFIEWELSAAIDQEGKMLPGRQYIRDICTQRYRIWDPTNPKANPDGYLYSETMPCPYTGSSAWTSTGQPTTAPFDSCGRRVADCKLRFGEDAALPFAGFPGIERLGS
jgi:lambda family phage minor tail protein L